ncbi:hypothetical protein QTP86_013151 [Hemibagrus guttatus]|nr:hypothetical protein QTP86_013151 [Hemibagrus guttatus]
MRTLGAVETRQRGRLEQEVVWGSQLSYRGRVLITNNLIASFLWHHFTVLEPPELLIKEVQKRIVNFFWAGQHWTRAPVLYLPLQEGGQGLIDLSCRVRTFRLQAAQRLFYGDAWADTAYALLRRVEDLNYDKHLFMLNLREMDLSATTLFYQSVLRAWSSVMRISRINAQPFPCTEEEPLFHSPLIQSRMISSPYIQQHFRRAGITRVKDLRSGNSWKTARDLCAETGVLSARLMQRLLGEVASALPSCFREALGQDPGRSHQPPPSLSISAAAWEYQWEKAALLSFQMPTLKDASKKALYETCVKVFIEVLWQYTLNVTRDIVRSLKALEIEIVELLRLEATGDRGHIEALKSKKAKMNDLLDITAQGALVRSRFKSAAEMDVPSKFFFSLEHKNERQKRFIHAVRTESGDLLSEPAKICKQTVSFYSKLYCSEWSEAQVVEDSFLMDLPKLSERAARELERELTLEELHEALQGLENGPI